ncbi:hypothetical protein GJ688_10360 [Heliobacillus mobilis]|uniref:Transposase n=1 Tax=Heliobacterium mobile TaxID=28064 RepID=A0A6I3SKI0_HELMO|nr:hypothetical protein [Heliobacterium mobile]MTV49380.1 hypothetical protein [Heliobacterium mobile]
MANAILHFTRKPFTANLPPDKLFASRYRFIYLAHSGLTSKEFYKLVLQLVNVAPKRGMPRRNAS